MINTTFTTSNHENNYNLFQLQLPLDVDTIIPNDDLVYTFIDILKGIDLTKYLSHHLPHGNQKHDQMALLKTILFAFSDNKRSLRQIEQACKVDIRYMWLSQESTPSFMTLQRFIKENLTHTIEDIFYDINNHLIKIDTIDMTKLYIDGTKIEAYARKTSFVWKKAILKHQVRLYDKITKAITQMNEVVWSIGEFHIQDSYKPKEVRVVIDYLGLLIQKYDVLFVHGKGTRKTVYQRYYEMFLEYEEKLLEYQIHLEICGSRNSYSKTDHDATFMNMKYDYYNRTGVFKPGYNLQIGVSDEYIMHVGLYANPTDTKTFIPFMESYYKRYQKHPRYPVGDAGYGSYDNYMYCVKNKMELSMKYNYFQKLHYDKKFKKKRYHAINFEENKKGYKICPGGHAFDNYQYDSTNKKGVYPQISQVYTTGKCEGCKLKKECTKASGERKLTRNIILEEFQKEADKVLLSNEGKELRQQRSSQAEGTFGVLKEDKKFIRFNRRGQENVETEMYLVAIGHNIRKYHSKKNRYMVS